MADSASDCLSGEYASDVDWMKLPSELWLEILSYLSPDSFIENLSPVIDLVSENLRSLSFCQITGNFVFGSDKRWTFYKFSNIVRLELTECEYVTAQILEEIRKNCTKIETLNLSGCSNVDDQAMQVVSKFEHLQILNISECSKVTDEGVNFIADMPCQILQFLSYDVQQISDRLECLYLQRATIISTQAINHLFQKKPRLNLTELSICFTVAVRDETVDAISSGCPHLESIDLNFCSEVTDKSIDKLIKSCRKLKVVSLHGLKNLEGNWLAEIDHYLPKLRCLGIAFCSGISEEKVKYLLLRKPDLTVIKDRTPIDELVQIGDTSLVLRKITLNDFERNLIED
ncbi:unnamed protein product [Clavelina lepadiformis]|uniref:F-box/LRR-repeat protein 15-like leucin rich repeat domain-containing protein n=1 Tax=Clavelina lepadiformis TaxID=159417 RepID=A0ABP0FCI4_CLALP